MKLPTRPHIQPHMHNEFNFMVSSLKFFYSISFSCYSIYIHIYIHAHITHTHRPCRSRHLLLGDGFDVFTFAFAIDLQAHAACNTASFGENVRARCSVVIFTRFDKRLFLAARKIALNFP